MKTTAALFATLLLGATVSAATVIYAIDDGVGNTNQGPPSTFNPDMLWMNEFTAQPGGEVITTVSVAFGSTWPTGGTVTFWVFEDNDDDGNPDTDCLAQSFATRDVSELNLGLNVFNDIPIPPATVSGKFFVGVSCFLTGGQDRPARVDTTAPADPTKSWFYYAPDIKSISNNLADAPFRSRMDNTSFVVFPGVFMIRATGVPSPPPNCPGDANGDGVIDAADLSVLLSNFGQPAAGPGFGDFNGDGQCNGADLSVLLSGFGQVC